ncbi:hypothetical protein PIB30_055267 [Stylosanthes scabra]|uniref:RNase H type-1 domain-containing protein n=1 Tax=Stylosanthes scabra TaxID=79078 RepID=A0ABU6RIY8_9FABA|nr:hypothetical protein [Stylosanthes scabra]
MGILGWLTVNTDGTCQLVGRWMTSSDVCPRCHLNSESLTHCLFFCPNALGIWHFLGLATFTGSSSQEFLEWIRIQCQRNPHLLAAAVWWIWRDRNNDVFNLADPWPASKSLLLKSIVMGVFWLMATLLAIWHGLVLAWENGCRQVICETDSIEAFSLINSGHASHASDHFDLLSKIIDVLYCWWSVCVTLIQRSANNVADYLAKYAAHAT